MRKTVKKNKISFSIGQSKFLNNFSAVTETQDKNLGETRVILAYSLLQFLIPPEFSLLMILPTSQLAGEFQTRWGFVQRRGVGEILPAGAEGRYRSKSHVPTTEGLKVPRDAGP